LFIITGIIDYGWQGKENGLEYPETMRLAKDVTGVLVKSGKDKNNVYHQGGR